MAAEHEEGNASSPDFEPSPHQDQSDKPAPPPEASAYESTKDDQPGMAALTGVHDKSASKKPSEKLAEKPKPDDKPKVDRSSLMSGGIMMLVGGAIGAGGFFLARAFAPPAPPKEAAEPKDMVKTEDFKKLTDRVDQMNSDLSTAKKQIADRPDYSPELKMQRDRFNDLDRIVAAMPAQIDSINQKLSTVSKIEDTNSAGRVEEMNKRLGDLAQTVESIKNSPAFGGNNMTPRGDMKVDAMAMDQAVNLFKAKKWSEARDGFTKLQSIFPNDATIWYYSALSTGFATGQWLGETEQLVNTGLTKERAGQPSTPTVDAAFNYLTPENGKTWLADYRKRIGVK